MNLAAEHQQPEFDFERHVEEGECHPLLQFNLKTYNLPVAYLLDWTSFLRINSVLTRHTVTPTDNINLKILLPQPTQTDYSEIVLVRGLSEDAKDPDAKIKMISPKANETIFTILGFSGHSVKRKIICEGQNKKIELYPRQIQFKLISPRILTDSIPTDGKEVTEASTLRLPRFQMNYDVDDGVSVLKDKIRKLLKTLSPSVSSQIKIYRYHHSLFKSQSFQRMLMYYFLKEDLQHISLPEQQTFYQMIERKNDDDFVVEAFPGKLMGEGNLGDLLREGDELVVESFWENKWVFPQQPSFSETRRCKFCHLMSHLYLRFQCRKCEVCLFFCSRVCHFQGLKEHSCPDALEEMQNLYGKIQEEDLKESMSGASKMSEGIVSSDSPSSQRTNSLVVPPSQIPVPRVQNLGRGGIENIGNSCYMNSSLQMLFKSKLGQTLSCFRDESAKQPLLTAYLKLLKYFMQSPPSREVSFAQIKMFKAVIDQQIPQFRGSEQHDAHQFLTIFLQKLHHQTLFTPKTPLGKDYWTGEGAGEEWLQFIKTNNSPIAALFYLQVGDTISCPHCHFERSRFDPFISLSCSIPVNIKSPQFEIYYESFQYKQVQLFRLKCEGTVLKLLQTFRQVAVIPGELKFNIKLFLTSYCGEIKECDLNGKMSDILDQTNRFMSRKPQLERRLFIFQPLFPASRTLFFRFNDPKGTSFSHKRPLFFKNQEEVISKSIYDAVRDYLFSIFTFYSHQTTDKIERELGSCVEKFFTLTHYRGGRVSQDHTVIFQHNGLKLSSQDEKALDIDDSGINEFWVDFKTTSKASDSQSIFWESISKNINKFRQKSDSLMPDSESSCLKLIDCLKEEFSSSVLSKGNEWNCPSCLEKRRAYQTTVLFKTGKYLLINIKRFKQNYQKNRIQKNCTRVVPPFQLNLQGILKDQTLPECYYECFSLEERTRLKLPEHLDKSKSCLYGLRGLILHRGTTRAGHYKATCALGQEWWEFQDNNVRPVNIKEELGSSETQKNVYIMLYERIGK